jgi:hypothetical protein
VDFPNSLPEFQKCFPDGQTCRVYLEAVKWPTGFVCLIDRKTGQKELLHNVD